MRNARTILSTLITVSLCTGAASWASVPKVVMVEDFTSTS